MKIELNVSDNILITKKHLRLIVDEIIENIVEDKNAIKFGIFEYSKLNIKDTKKVGGFESGNRLGMNNIFYSKKTKPSGKIIINVWGN